MSAFGREKFPSTQTLPPTPFLTKPITLQPPWGGLAPGIGLWMLLGKLGAAGEVTLLLPQIALGLSVLAGESSLNSGYF